MCLGPNFLGSRCIPGQVVWVGRFYPSARRTWGSGWLRRFYDAVGSGQSPDSQIKNPVAVETAAGPEERRGQNKILISTIGQRKKILGSMSQVRRFLFDLANKGAVNAGKDRP